MISPSDRNGGITVENLLKSLGAALAEQVFDLKPVPADAVPMECETLTLDGTEPTNAPWLQWMETALAGAGAFEIHCWKEETEWIHFALNYGSVKPSDWKYGTIIEGPVTPEFSRMLLPLPKPTDTEICNKMTPFFSVFLDNGYESAHYGTELHHVFPPIETGES